MAFLLLFIMSVLGFVWFMEMQAGSFLSSFSLKAAEVTGVVAFYLAFTMVTSWRRRSVGIEEQGGSSDGGPLLVAYASQTGVATELAYRTALALKEGGRAVRLIDFSGLDETTLADTQTALFVASTTGEGDPPDIAGRFASRYLNAANSLAHLRYAVLALGDKNYSDFCGFGRRLDLWLKESEAKPIFDRIDVDCVDEGAVTRWFDRVGTLGAVGSKARTPTLEDWRLVSRTQLNAGSENPAIYKVTLTSQSSFPTWQAGDIAVVAPRNAPARVESYLQAAALDGDILVTGAIGETTLRQALSCLSLPDMDMVSSWQESPQALVDSLRSLPRREYSLASVQQDAQVELVVRQMHHSDGRLGGRLGSGSGWLTAFAQVGGLVEMSLRSNSGFHGPDKDCPMILIGAGSGIAGLRAHMKERIAAGHMRNWLIFGERDANVDFLFQEEIEKWQASGALEQLNLCFMQDGIQRTVQDALRSEGATLQRWLADEGVVYVCGSRMRIGNGVDAVLKETIGDRGLRDLVDCGRYKRDVY